MPLALYTCCSLNSEARLHRGHSGDPGTAIRACVVERRRLQDPTSDIVDCLVQSSRLLHLQVN